MDKCAIPIGNLGEILKTLLVNFITVPGFQVLL